MKGQVFIPHEDDPEVVIRWCLECGQPVEIYTPDDGELEGIGHSLGDPSEED
jgi:hypothetical protein